MFTCRYLGVSKAKIKRVKKLVQQEEGVKTIIRLTNFHNSGIAALK